MSEKNKNNTKPIIKVSNLRKKFSSDLKLNMWYGLQGLCRNLIGKSDNYDILKPKEFWALNNINLDIFAGDVLALTGHNGSGKTTLLRLISSVYHLESGDVSLIDDLRITSLFSMKSGMHNLYTGRENIFLKGALFGMTKKEIKNQMDFIISFSGLGEELEKPLGNYSSGMKSRLAFSVAMATEPHIFIIDEGLAFSDELFKMKSFHYLKEYAKKPSCAVMMATHQLGKIHRLANRIVILEKGKLLYESRDIKEGMKYYLKHISKKSNEIPDQSLSDWFRDTSKE
jgi:lipopolysaccharide transport system ATP-binding protein